jgi:hypothetical protein
VDATPELVAEPPTVMEPPATFAVGVRVIAATPLDTVAVYAVVVDKNTGLSVPELSAKPCKLASAFTDAVLVIAIV